LKRAADHFKRNLRKSTIHKTEPSADLSRTCSSNWEFKQNQQKSERKNFMMTPLTNFFPLKSRKTREFLKWLDLFSLVVFCNSVFRIVNGVNRAFK
jgi:hypothetical protein